MPAVERTGDGFNQDRKCGEAPQTTRLPQRKYSLDPAIALRVVGALHDLAPEHGKPQRAVELSERVTPPAGLQNRACHFRGTRLLS
jgi:hypothetical protein